MALEDNLRSTSFTSTHPMDKVVRVDSGSFNAGTAPKLGGTIPYTSFSHGFTRPVFTKLLFSDDNSIWFDGNTSVPGKTNAITYSTSSKIFVLTSKSSGTLYYRVMSFWIDNYDGTNPLVAPTVGSSSDFYFDSRLNYKKIKEQGSYTRPSGSVTGPTHSKTISHNLGYVPNVLVYIEALPGEIWSPHWGGTKNPWLYDIDMIEVHPKLETNSIKVDTFGSTNSPSAEVFYIIYHDEASG